MSFQAPRGTRDFLPESMAVRRHVEGAWRKASIDFGFEEVDGPTFEHVELYTVKSGEGIVNELFSFKRSGGSDTYALRPEFTPTLARMLAAAGGSLPLPVKWFTIPTLFRAERPQRGRLREFVQWNVDVVGIDSPAADVETMAVAAAALDRLGLRPKDVQLRISHRGAVAGLLEALGVPAERHGAAFELLDRRDRLEPEEYRRRRDALLGGTGAGAEAARRLDELLRRTIPVAELDARAGALGLPETALEPLRAIAAELRAADLAPWASFDFGIVRGLAYYTGVVFEIHEATGAERAVAGGGRYDGLVELFGGPRMPAVGFGMGDVVLGLLLEERGLLGGEGGRAALLPRPDAFVISAGSEADLRLRAVVSELRRAGLHARHSYRTTRNVGKLLGEASRCRSRCAVILGAELGAGLVALKDLGGGEQRLVPVGDVVAEVRRLAQRSE
ncbi:MAG TPA: histidine--tRNA ligase [Phycisphaerales bacterium]|nr:histidine--tRNA ligase [Phycisphaerales bacterium]HMP36766.1 histidine--tRNA ligase [Phycisphaerales bacterium]